MWSQLVFVLPYAWVVLAETRAQLNPGYRIVARTLGAAPATAWARVVLPLLARPILLAIAVCFSVSMALYLPTLFAGGGRIVTLTTEAGGGHQQWRPAFGGHAGCDARRVTAAGIRRLRAAVAPAVSPTAGDVRMSRLTLEGVTLAVSGRRLLGPLDARIRRRTGRVRHQSERLWQIQPARIHLRRVSAGNLTAGWRILLDDVDITCTPTEQRGLGILFQDDLLFRI